MLLCARSNGGELPRLGELQWMLKILDTRCSMKGTEAEVDLLRIREARQLWLSRRNDRDDEAAGRVRNSTRRLSLEEIVAEGNVGQVEMLE
jgi:hypothetical protein